MALVFDPTECYATSGFAFETKLTSVTASSSSSGPSLRRCTTSYELDLKVLEAERSSSPLRQHASPASLTAQALRRHDRSFLAADLGSHRDSVDSFLSSQAGFAPRRPERAACGLPGLGLSGFWARLCSGDQ